MPNSLQDFIDEVISSGQFIQEFGKWFFDLRFQLNLLQCCLDKENFDIFLVSSVLAFYGIPLSLFAIICCLAFFILLLHFYITTIFLICVLLSIFFLIVSLLSFYKMFNLTKLYYKKSELHLNGTQNSIFSPNMPHHGIVFAQQISPIRKMFISDSVDLLISLFDEKIPFKVYPIYFKEDFSRVYSNPNVKWLWIIGHGWRGGFVYSEKECEAEIEYSNYEKNSNLLFIAQFHCNNHQGQSLFERNGLKPNHDIEHLRFPFQNRCYITKKVKEFLSQIH
jgi:hypothetical protein